MGGTVTDERKVVGNPWRRRGGQGGKWWGGGVDGRGGEVEGEAGKRRKL